jgi:hypothetical protein
VTVAEAIERYLRTGQHEHDHPEWPGQNIWEKAKNGHDDLARALVEEVKERSQGHQHSTVPSLDLTAWTRRKLTPMVHGLFPQVEREAVLALLERSVVFLTSDNVEQVLLKQMWLHSAWDLANLYLGSLDADLLGPDAPSLLGLSQETTCYVSADYFSDRGKVEDFVIHEAASNRSTGCVDGAFPDINSRRLSEGAGRGFQNARRLWRVHAIALGGSRCAAAVGRRRSPYGDVARWRVGFGVRSAGGHAAKPCTGSMGTSLTRAAG